MKLQELSTSSATKKQILVRRTVLAVTLAFYLFVAWTVFYSPIDDWRWSLDEIGLRWWLEGVYNNRYVGNFFAVVLTRSPVLKTLVMGGVTFAIPFLMALLAAGGRRSASCRPFWPEMRGFC